MYLMFGITTQTERERRFAIEINPYKLIKRIAKYTTNIAHRISTSWTIDA